MQNPYTWNKVKPELCYGRDSLLGELLSSLPGNPSHSFGLAGGRRMGKSTILRRVEQDLQASIPRWQASGTQVIPIYIDGLALPRPFNDNDVWGEILGKLKIALRVEVPVDKPDYTTFTQLLQPILVELPEYPRIIVLFDEVEPIVACDWAEGFFANWRALLSNTPGLQEYFTAVFAGAKELNLLRVDVGSPLKDILEWRNLHPLDCKDACDLMQEPIEHSWSTEFLETVYQETGGHPFLIQYIMYHVCQIAPDTETKAQQAIISAREKFMTERSWQFDEWWTRYCTPTAQRVYHRLPDDKTTLSIRTIIKEFGRYESEDAFAILQHLGLAIKDEDNLTVGYTGEMFRRWYRPYGSLDLNKREGTIEFQYDTYLYKRLAKITPDLANKYTDAWRIYQLDDLNTYASVISEIRETLTILLNKIASKDEVMVHLGRKLDRSHPGSEWRERVKYVAKKNYDQYHSKRTSKEKANEVVNEVDLLEDKLDKLSNDLAKVVNQAYGRASAYVHAGKTTRDDVYTILKQFDSIMLQLTQSTVTELAEALTGLDRYLEGDEMQEEYIDFDLYISPNGHIRAHSNEGNRTVDISVVVPNEIQLTLNLIEAKQTNEELLRNFGKQLYNIIFPNPTHIHFNQTEAVARSKNQKIRLRLTIEPDELARLPWEFTYREEGGYFLASNPNTVLSRYLDLPMPQNRVRKRTGPLHMLIITSEPSDQAPFKPDKDKWIKMITDALATLISNGELTVSVVKQATRRKISNALLEEKPDIVQFIGHGIYRNGKGYLALVDNDTDKAWLVDDAQFANIFLGNSDHLGLVSLATCESAKSDSPQSFLGIAPKIVQRGVSAVVAMQYSVLMASAKVFLEEFYSAVASRKPVDWSVQWARNQVSLEYGLDNREFATPVLYMRAKDGDVF